MSPRSGDSHSGKTQNGPGDDLSIHRRGATTTGALVQNMPMPPGLAP